MSPGNLEAVSDLRISAEKAPGGVTAVSLAGVVDAYSLEQFSRFFNSLIEQKGYRLIVDLSGLEYINAHGTGILVGVHGIARQNNGDMVLVNPSRIITDEFEPLGFSNLIKTVSDKTRALEFFNPVYRN